MVCSGGMVAYVALSVCSPVTSAVKPNSPLPTLSGLAASMAATRTSCRVTSALRSIAGGGALPALALPLETSALALPLAAATAVAATTASAAKTIGRC